jgi:hypothetical protein
VIRLGLRARFFLYSNTLIAATMTVVTLFAMVHERGSQHQAIDQRGRSIADAMGVLLTNLMLGQLGAHGDLRRDADPPILNLNPP